MTGLTLTEDSSSWKLDITQDKMTVQDIDLYLSQSVLSALAQLAKDAVKGQLLSALKDQVFPQWTNIVN